MNPSINDIESYIKAKGLGNVVVYTAGSATYDNALYTTDYIDTLGYGSIVFACNYTVSLASGESFTVPGTIQHSADTTLASFTAVDTLHLGTLTASGAALVATTGALANGYNLNRCKRYVRFVARPDLSAAGTDTAVVAYTAIVGGAQVLPAT